jgi:hypothetical protein
MIYYSLSQPIASGMYYSRPAKQTKQLSSNKIILLHLERNTLMTFARGNDFFYFPGIYTGRER